MAELTQLPRFDGGKWVKVARLVVAASLVLSVATVAILLIADPPKQCPNWHLKNTNLSSLWEAFVMLTVPLNIFGCFIAVRWNWVVRRAVESEGRQTGALFGHMAPPPVPISDMMVKMCIMNSVASQFPLFLLVTQCLIH
jgi:hypothetical protein